MRETITETTLDRVERENREADARAIIPELNKIAEWLETHSGHTRMEAARRHVNTAILQLQTMLAGK